MLRLKLNPVSKRARRYVPIWLRMSIEAGLIHDFRIKKNPDGKIYI